MPIKRITPAKPAPDTSPTPPPKKEEYEVGYRKPPKAHRFKPGQSGNPNGRPKSAKSLNTIVREVMLEKVPVRTGSTERRVSRAEALVMKQLELASKGDLRALMHLLQLFQAAVPDQPPGAADGAPEENSEADLAILAALQAHLLSQADNKLDEGES